MDAGDERAVMVEAEVSPAVSVVSVPLTAAVLMEVRVRSPSCVGEVLASVEGACVDVVFDLSERFGAHAVQIGETQRHRKMNATPSNREMEGRRQSQRMRPAGAYRAPRAQP